LVTHLKASASFEHETYREIVSACMALGLYCSGIGHLVFWWIRTIVLEELEHEKLRSHTQFWLGDFEGVPGVLISMMVKLVFENGWPAELCHGDYLLSDGKCFIILMRDKA
jgi:hypothetical protein